MRGKFKAYEYQNVILPIIVIRRLECVLLNPPKKEQEAITEYLDTKEREILLIKAMLSQQISTLAAYRKSLINEGVTGQRRISEADVARVHKMVGDNPT